MGIMKKTWEHVKHRLSPVTMGKEAINTISDKFVPHGADEFANVLFTGQAYTQSLVAQKDLIRPMPAERDPEQPKQEAARPDPPRNEGPSKSLDGYMNGYRDMLQKAADRAQFRKPDTPDMSR